MCSLSFPARCGTVLISLMLAGATTGSLHAQGEMASGTLSASGSGPYSYDLTFSDAAAATSPIGSIWYAWVPGSFYLPGTPTSVAAPIGWTATISGHSVQYVASSAADYIQPGASLSGFSYQALFSPAELAAAPNSGVSVAYSGGLFSDAGNTFSVAMVPEPSGGLLLLGCLAAGVVVRRSRRAAREATPHPAAP